MSYDISKVTPRPWEHQEHPANPRWARVKGLVKGRTPASEGANEFMSPEDVAHIVACVNAHDELVEALENICVDIAEHYQSLPREIQADFESACAILKKVKE